VTDSDGIHTDANNVIVLVASNEVHGTWSNQRPKPWKTNKNTQLFLSQFSSDM
jgi:hypothetical protein